MLGALRLDKDTHTHVIRYYTTTSSRVNYAVRGGWLGGLLPSSRQFTQQNKRKCCHRGTQEGDYIRINTSPPEEVKEAMEITLP